MSQDFTAPPLPTDVGGIERAGKRAGAGVLHIDPRDPDQVYALAVRLQNAPRLRLFQPTLDEIQGLARLVVLATPVFEKAVELVELSDKGEARPGCTEALKALIAITREQLDTLEKRT